MFWKLGLPRTAHTFMVRLTTTAVVTRESRKEKGM